MKNHIVLLFLLICCWTVSTPLYSADSVAVSASLVSEKKVNDKINEVKDSTAMGDEAKNALLSLYSRTLDNLDALKTYNQQIKVYQNAIKKSPDEIKIFKKKIAALEKKNTKVFYAPGELKKLSLADLEQRLNSESANLAAIDARFSDLEQTLEHESSSSENIRKQLIDANHKLELLLEEKNQPVSGTSSELKRANQWLIDAHIAALRSELRMLDKQLLSLPVRLKLLKQKKIYTGLNLKRIANRVLELRKEVDKKRTSEIKKTQDITRDEQLKAEGKAPVILKLAKANSKLSELINSKNQKLSLYENDEERIDKETKKIVDAFASTRKKLKIAGLNQVMGQMLLEERKSLPEKNLYLKRMDKREKFIAQANLLQLQYQEEFKKISDIRNYINEMLKGITPQQKKQLVSDLKPLLVTRKNLLKKLS